MKALDRLRARGVSVPVSVQEWLAARAGQEWFRTVNGSVVRRERFGPSGEPGRWVRFVDDVGLARQPLGLLPKLRPGEKPGPVYFEGIDPPWMVMRVAAERPVQADGFAPGLVLVVEDPLEVLDACAVTDLEPLLSEERVELIVGPGAIEGLERRLAARLPLQLGSICLRVDGSRLGPTGGVVERALASQRVEGELSVSAARAAYAGRDRGWWARRYAEALRAGSNDPLRVLLPTTRYSTYLRYASGDLARAFEAAGHRARVLIEPDDSSTLLGWAYADAVREFDADLVVMLNYPRRHLEGVLPAEVPVVCWVQDAMGHLFDRAVGTSQGPLDFLAGHLHMSFFGVFGYPMERAVAFPVLASAAKFHDGPADSAWAERAACEIACVTHHSQTPAELRLRMIAEAMAGPDPVRARAIIESIGAAIDGMVQRAMAAPLAGQVRSVVVEAIRRTGQEATEEQITRVANRAAWPMLDRAIRHQTLAWAAGVAERRGWRMHIYGRGWEKHPQLGRYARGELEHGEALRAAYQCAAVNLHASAHTNIHQRVMECALAGGLPLCRLTMDHLCQLGGYAAASLVHAGAPIEARVGEALPTAAACDHWSAMALCAQLQRLGVDGSAPGGFHIGEQPMPPGRVPIAASVRTSPWRYNANAPQSASVLWLLGDLAESTFWSAETLEARVERAMERRAWRESLSRGMARRVREELTYEVAADRLARFVGACLARG
ncbi:MAG: hypothetical protein AB7K52_03145 [Phycisphaerales bacterium]